MISPYPAHKHTDAVLERLGEDFSYDSIHALGNEEDDEASEEEDAETPNGSSDESSDEGDAAVAGDDRSVAAVAGDHGGDHNDDRQSTLVEVPLSASQADAVHQVEITIAALQGTLDSLKAIGSVRAAQCVEQELQKERRKQRALVKESPAVAESFLRLRRAEEQDTLMKRRQAAELKDKKRQAEQAICDRDTAIAERKRIKRDIQEMESVRASRHAIKTFTLDALGADSENAGGVKGRKNRFEVLDRLSHLKAGLSAGQRNDWPWFQHAWDQAMVAEHKGKWASVFSGWVQHVLDDERSNAFSEFVYSETCRVLADSAVLQVPGI